MSQDFRPTLRQKLGCWAHERWRAEMVLSLPEKFKGGARHWQALCNRHERLTRDPYTGSYSCEWEDTSTLTAARVFPRFGGRLLHQCLLEWPVEFASDLPSSATIPEVSFVLGVRGLSRLPQFGATLSSIMAQSECPCEIIVVEQAWEQRFSAEIPAGVRYIFSRSTHPDTPFNRSWALNVGVQEARGRIVVLHDADMLVPKAFAKTLEQKISGKIDGMKIPRFIFYLDQKSSRSLIECGDFSHVKQVNSVVQNNRTPIALTRAAYYKIGGHDEAFYCWGGEDNEFIDRARTLNFCEGAIFPLVHLWHETAHKKQGDRNRKTLDQLMNTPTEDRIRNLVQRAFGQSKPAVPWTETSAN